MPYTACLDVVDYDDDFILLLDGTPIPDNAGRSVCGEVRSTEHDALLSLLNRLTVNNRANTLSLDAPLPPGFHHVKEVRERLAEMTMLCSQGQTPAGERMRWRGNWNITFKVRWTVSEDKPVKRRTPNGR